jgi:hypothetical protein
MEAWVGNRPEKKKFSVIWTSIILWRNVIAQKDGIFSHTAVEISKHAQALVDTSRKTWGY